MPSLELSCSIKFQRIRDHPRLSPPAPSPSQGSLEVKLFVSKGKNRKSKKILNLDKKNLHLDKYNVLFKAIRDRFPVLWQEEELHTGFELG